MSFNVTYTDGSTENVSADQMTRDRRRTYIRGEGTRRMTTKLLRRGRTMSIKRLPSSLGAFAADTARAHDARLASMAATANNIANETQDPRWNEAALALLGARRFFRDLMQDGERKQ